MNAECIEIAVRLGNAQVDAMFKRQNKGPVIDDAEFVPLVVSVLMAFETAGFESKVVENLWEYFYAQCDRYCNEADPAFTTSENILLMRSYLLGPRRIKRKKR